MRIHIYICVYIYVYIYIYIYICVYHFLFGRLFNTGTRQVSSRSHKDKREAYSPLLAP